MPVLIPIIVAAAAYAGGAAVVMTFALTGLAAIAVGTVVGAVIGAAVGAVGAALTGGDVGKGALWGAVGGAVAGGFGGFAAGAAVATAASNAASASIASNSTKLAIAEKSLAAGSGASAGAGMSAGEGAIWGSTIQTAGTMAMGYAQGEDQGQIVQEDREVAEQARGEDFEQKMKEIAANHQARLAEIGVQSENSIALADKNNAASMNQLKTRIGAEEDTVTVTNEDRDAKIAGFNESIRGTDVDLFTRPTFEFEPMPEEDVFDSGFEEAVKESPNLPPEELRAIENVEEQASYNKNGKNTMSL